MLTTGGLEFRSELREVSLGIRDLTESEWKETFHPFINPRWDEILSQLLAQELKVFINHFGVDEKIQRVKATKNGKNTHPELEGAMHEAATRIAAIDDRIIYVIDPFLASPEMGSMIRQIYAALLDGSEADHIGAIKRELLWLLALHAKRTIEDESIKILSEQLFEVVVNACQRALNRAVDQGILSAHEARSQIRHNFILDRLRGIEKNLTFLQASHQLNVEAVLTFESRYRSQVAQRYSTLTPPFIDSARKVDIDALYVPSSIVRGPKRAVQQTEVLDLPRFRNLIYHTVLLGNPGGGKSTFSLKLCHDLATRYEERLLANRLVTPILVILREYGEKKKERGCSILGYIEATARERHQLQVPSGAFEYLLLNGRTVVIFDGLDELLETRDRQEISADVESFCNLYPDVPILVTSREVGYDEAPLDPRHFEIFRLAPFEDQQVENYVNKWYQLDAELTSEQRSDTVSAFMRESASVKDLRSNPLMLGLMCNIYRGEGYIPPNRPDLYKKCADMLFERWDKGRGIDVPQAHDVHTRNVMMHLAYWIYTNEKLLNEGVTEERLITETTNYLCPRQYEDRDKAERAAQELVEFCRGRAWVFSDVGTTPKGEKLYQFTHRTFLEYFTASHLVRTHPTPDRLGPILLPRIAAKEWDVIAQLAFQILNKQTEGAGDELLSMLISSSDNQSSEGWNLLAFAARCLAFMVPTTSIRRNVTSACIERTLSNGLRYYDQKTNRVPGATGEYIGTKQEELIAFLLTAAPENRDTIASHLQYLLSERISQGNGLNTRLAAHIAVRLPLFVNAFRGGAFHVSDQLSETWRNVSTRVVEQCIEQIRAMFPHDLFLCHWGVSQEMASATDLMKWHGINQILAHVSSPVLPGHRFSSIGDTLLRSSYVLGDSVSKSERRIVEECRSIGAFLLESPPPWFTHRYGLLGSRSLSSILRPTQRKTSTSKTYEELWDPTSIFGAFCLIAAKLEMSEGVHSILPKLVKSSHAMFFSNLSATFIARLNGVKKEVVQQELDRCALTLEQQTLIWQWIQKKVSFVRMTGPTRTVALTEVLEDQ
ncbi:MAG: NACHT domain-containing protein [Chloroflexota bacterium]|nr:NACHT domain-containing protein [Chloroflexota bacterium]MDQ5865424.1 NACHT domain-containing protein [Chloroflexota bacterium]